MFIEVVCADDTGGSDLSTVGVAEFVVVEGPVLSTVGVVEAEPVLDGAGGKSTVGVLDEVVLVVFVELVVVDDVLDAVTCVAVAPVLPVPLVPAFAVYPSPKLIVKPVTFALVLSADTATSTVRLACTVA